jgi:hypothetical protein
MQQSVAVSRNAEDDDFMLNPVAHQFDCVHENEPVAQIMIQLIGYRIEARRTQIDPVTVFKVKSFRT